MDALRMIENDSGTDYELQEPGCWIKVGDLSIWIRDFGTGAQIEVYNDGKEMEPPIHEIFVQE